MSQIVVSELKLQNTAENFINYFCCAVAGGLPDQNKARLATVSQSPSFA